ncbi:hypothetical protein WDU94_002152 [Cyamophila willieti]
MPVGGGGGGDTIQDFEFKDTSDTSGAESSGGNGVWSLPPGNMNALNAGGANNYLLDGLTQNKMNSIHRYHSKYNMAEQLKFGGNTGSFYYKEKPLQTDFKVSFKLSYPGLRDPGSSTEFYSWCVFIDSSASLLRLKKYEVGTYRDRQTIYCSYEVPE